LLFALALALALAVPARAAALGLAAVLIGVTDPLKSAFAFFALALALAVPARAAALGLAGLLALAIPWSGLLLFRPAGPGGATPWWGFGGEAPNSKLLVVPLGTPFSATARFFSRARFVVFFPNISF